jgi:hypothetical protein
MPTPRRRRRLIGLEAWAWHAPESLGQQGGVAGVMKVVGIFVHKGDTQIGSRKMLPLKEVTMPTKPLPAKQRPDVQALAQAIRESTEAEVDELACLLLDTDDAHLFGDTEFTIRALAHKIAAGAIEQHLARKKTATTAPG